MILTSLDLLTWWFQCHFYSQTKKIIIIMEYSFKKKSENVFLSRTFCPSPSFFFFMGRGVVSPVIHPHWYEWRRSYLTKQRGKSTVLSSFLFSQQMTCCCQTSDNQCMGPQGLCKPVTETILWMFTAESFMHYRPAAAAVLLKKKSSVKF